MNPFVLQPKMGDTQEICAALDFKAAKLVLTHLDRAHPTACALSDLTSLFLLPNAQIQPSTDQSAEAFTFAVCGIIGNLLQRVQPYFPEPSTLADLFDLELSPKKRGLLIQAMEQSSSDPRATALIGDEANALDILLGDLKTVFTQTLDDLKNRIQTSALGKTEGGRFIAVLLGAAEDAFQLMENARFIARYELLSELDKLIKAAQPFAATTTFAATANNNGPYAGITTPAARLEGEATPKLDGLIRCLQELGIEVPPDLHLRPVVTAVSVADPGNDVAKAICG